MLSGLARPVPYRQPINLSGAREYNTRIKLGDGLGAKDRKDHAEDKQAYMTDYANSRNRL